MSCSFMSERETRNDAGSHQRSLTVGRLGHFELSYDRGSPQFRLGGRSVKVYGNGNVAEQWRGLYAICWLSLVIRL
jgi:hypothetical protein